MARWSLQRYDLVYGELIMGYDFGNNASLIANGSALEFYTNSAKRAEITTAGYLRKYALPAAQGTWHTAGGVSATGTYPITALTVNQSGFGDNATSNYFFVAPISGIYYCHTAAITGNNNDFLHGIMKNGGHYGTNYPSRAGIGRAAGSWSTANNNLTDFLNAGDNWRFYVDAGTYYHGSYHSGILAFQIG